MSRQAQEWKLDSQALRPRPVAPKTPPQPPSLAVRARGLLARRSRPVTVAASLAAHLSILLALLWVQAERPVRSEPMPVTVQLIDGKKLSEAATSNASSGADAAQPTPPQPTPPKPAPPKPTPEPPSPKPKPAKVATPKPTPAKSVPRKVAAAPTPTASETEDGGGGGSTGEAAVQLSDSQIAGAGTADSGPPGRTCNMVRWLQDALRKDAAVQAAISDAHRVAGPGTKAVMVWNGAWIRSVGQDGDGLAGVREAIMVEIAFAPEACRADPVQGLVLLSLNDGPGAARVAMGAGQWRWSDLLRHR